MPRKWDAWLLVSGLFWLSVHIFNYDWLIDQAYAHNSWDYR